MLRSVHAGLDAQPGLLARNEEVIREHARRSGFPADRITEVRRMIDPTTAAG